MALQTLIEQKEAFFPNVVADEEPAYSVNPSLSYKGSFLSYNALILIMK